ncbi:MAG: MarR family winged helix-turn-helix transcriptional regulator [Dehalococcoidia bacterium]
MTHSEPAIAAEDDIGLLCLVVSSGVTEFVLQRLAASGFADTKFSHGFIVQGLLAGDTTVTELAERLGVSVQAVSKTVQEVESLGYLEKRPDPNDRRSSNLLLTERAHANIAAARAARFEIQTELSQRLGDGGDRFLAQLRSLADRFGGLSALAERRLRPPV